MEKNKIEGYLNICHKAGYLIIGGENLENYNKKLYLVLFDKTSQKNTLKVVEKLKDKVETIEVENLSQLSKVENCKIIGIKNKKISEILISLLRND